MAHEEGRWPEHSPMQAFVSEVTKPQEGEDPAYHGGVIKLAADELFERLSKIGFTMATYEHIAASTLNQLIPKDEVGWFAAAMCVSEAGEVLEHFRKSKYQGHELNTEKVLYELGDLLWALTITARALGSSLDQVARMNNDKLAKRYPEGFTVADSIARVDGL